MRRRLFNFAAAASLLLCVAAGTLWVRSLGHFEQVFIRYARWPQADEYRSFSVGFSWYSNTLRLEITRFTRLPSRFRQVLPARSEESYRRQVMRLRASSPPGLHWRFDGAEDTRAMNGYPPGFRARHSPYTDDPAHPGDNWVLAVRPWLPTLLTAVLPVIWTYRFQKTRRARRQGLCPNCGYDLRATPEPGGALLSRCPECGAVPSPPARPAARPAAGAERDSG